MENRRTEGYKLVGGAYFKHACYTLGSVKGADSIEELDRDEECG
jgi:hypothetical protein